MSCRCEKVFIHFSSLTLKTVGKVFSVCVCVWGRGRDFLLFYTTIFPSRSSHRPRAASSASITLTFKTVRSTVAQQVFTDPTKDSKGRRRMPAKKMCLNPFWIEKYQNIWQLFQWKVEEDLLCVFIIYCLLKSLSVLITSFVFWSVVFTNSGTRQASPLFWFCKSKIKSQLGTLRMTKSQIHNNVLCVSPFWL